MTSEAPIFQNVLSQDWHRLPPIMHIHYKNRPYSQDLTTFEGHMNVAFRGLFYLITPLCYWLKILPPYQGSHIPVTVQFRSDPNSKAYHLERTFHFPEKKPYHFHTYMLPVKDNLVVEHFLWRMGWRTRYTYDGKKIMLSHDSFGWQIGKFWLPLPIHWILGKCEAEEVALSENEFSMRMTFTHPWFGQQYLYEGTFRFVP